MNTLPRVSLAALPTPLHDVPLLREALGGPSRCPKILIKRDDVTGLALGGNKARKLEYLIADALRHEASVVITSGAAQSNHARMTAAAARAVGLNVALVLATADANPAVQGNLLLNRLFDATIHFVPLPSDPMLATGDLAEAKVEEVVADLRARGERPYVIPAGGSSPVGAFGYVTGTAEIVAQLRAMEETPARLYFATGTRGTHAGLALGAKVWNAPYAVYGVAISGGESWKRERAVEIANEAASLGGVAPRVTADDLMTDQRYKGAGYGIPTDDCLEAIRMVARHAGILLDPVYTGKAMAGLIDHVRRGELDPSRSVVFLHTGGVPGLFAQAARF